ncbi:O-antigen ligase family protein [Symbiobacterium terraclitae]|uniref:O-antigen ligase family protein n=1 Tax=Symbiobacterium terraclitae TaxID=557451 RepID=UPI0035B50C10
MTTRLTIRRLGLALLLITIAVGPLFQGYFFPTPTLVATSVVSLSFIIWLYGRRKERIATNFFDGRPSLALLALTGWVILVAVWSIYARGTIDLLLMVISAYFVYLMLQHESNAVTHAWVVRILSASALLVAIVGLLEYSGFFMEHPGIGELLRVEPQRSRIYTLFQYPNTAAIFFVATILLQNATLIQSSSRAEKLSLAAISGIVATTFLFTLSRGGVIIAPVAVLLLWAGLTRGQLITSLLHLVSAVVLPAGVVFYPILKAAPADNWIAVLLWAVAAGGIGAAATLVLERLERLPRQVSVITAGILVAVLAIGGVVVARSLDLPRVFNRITQLNTSDLADNARFEYLQDAMKLTAQRPWGYGGGGWLRTYQQVQTVNYVARDPHSHYALMLVEAGVPGLLLVLAAIALAAHTAFRWRRGEPVRWAMAAVGVTLAVHAAVDVDLSYYMMWLLLWTALGASQPEPEPQPLKKERRLAFQAALALAATAVFLSGTLATAALSFASAENAVLRGDHDTARKVAQRAMKLDPLNSEYRTMIPTSENIKRALALDPYNEKLWRFVSSIFEEQGDAESALVAAKRALQLRPMSVGHYERVAELLVDRMTLALEEGQTSEALAFAHDLIALGQAMEERGAPSLERQKRTFYAYPALTWTSHLNLAVGKAHLVAGELAAAEARLTSALDDEQTATDAALWLHALYTRTADQQALMALRPRPTKKALNSRLYQALTATQ